MNRRQRQAGYLRHVIVALCAICLGAGPAAATDKDSYQTAQGLAVYLGVLPAEIIRGHPSGHTERAMHGGTSKSSHEHHVVVAIDSATGARISDAAVTAQISGLGLSGTKKKLEPMMIANTTTYGNFLDLPGRDLYSLKLIIQLPGRPTSATLEFKYDHR